MERDQLYTRTIALDISYNARLEFLIDTGNKETKEPLHAALKSWEKMRK